MNSIHASRAAALALVMTVVYTVRSFGARIHYWLGAALAVGISGLAVVNIGSSGPAIAAVSAVLAAIAVLLRRAGRSRIGLLVGTATVILALVATVGVEFTRILTTDDNGRQEIYDLAVPALLSNPSGVGWGNYQTLPGAEPHQWPHNVFLEIGIEGGWIALLAFTVLCVAGLRKSLRAALTGPTPTATYIFAFVVYALVSAQVSADLTGNVLVWSSLGMAFAIPRTEAAASSSGANVQARAI